MPKSLEFRRLLFRSQQAVRQSNCRRFPPAHGVANNHADACAYRGGNQSAFDRLAEKGSKRFSVEELILSGTRSLDSGAYQPPSIINIGFYPLAQLHAASLQCFIQVKFIRLPNAEDNSFSNSSLPEHNGTRATRVQIGMLPKPVRASYHRRSEE